MTQPTSPFQPGEQYVLTDASGRTFVSSAPTAHAPVPQAIQASQRMATHCACAHTPAPVRRTHGLSPALMLAVGAGGVVVLVALLLSVAVVAASVATCALALTVCAVVLRAMVNKPPAHGRYRR